jgi:hypothetical protein
MSDHEDSLASLGRAEVSPVHHSIRPPIPEVPQDTEDGGCVPPPVAPEESGGVLDDHPAGLGVVEDPGELEEVPGSSSREAGAMRGGDGGVLAGEASCGDVSAR